MRNGQDASPLATGIDGDVTARAWGILCARVFVAVVVIESLAENARLLDGVEF